MHRNIVGLTAILLGCASSSAVITESRTTTPGPPSHVSVFLSILRSKYNAGIYHGFQRQMERELTTCQVTSSIVWGMPPEGREGEPGPGVDARLIVRAGSGLLTTTTIVHQYGAREEENDMELQFWLELVDFKLKRTTWQAFARLDTHPPGTEGGVKLASTIAARLRSDGVLTRCR